MPGFVQIIQWKTSQIDEVKALSEEYRGGRDPQTGPSRVLVLADRDNPGTYYTVAQFASAEAAEANNGRPETEAFAKRMGELCDGPPTFHNTDVVEDETFA